MVEESHGPDYQTFLLCQFNKRAMTMYFDEALWSAWEEKLKVANQQWRQMRLKFLHNN